MKRIFGIIILIIIILIFVFSFSSNGNDNTDYVLLIDDVPVTKKEYLFLLYEEKVRFEKEGSDIIWEVKFDGVPAPEIAKQNAIDTARLVKLSSLIAKKNRITITIDEEEDFTNFRNSLFADIPENILEKIGLDEEEKNEIARDNFLYFKLFNKITENKIFEQSELDNYVKEYMEENEDVFKDIYVNYIFLDLFVTENFQDEKEYENYLNNIYEEVILNVDNFNEMIKKYSDSYNEDSEIISSKKISEDNFPDEVVKTSFELNKGEISNIITTNEGFFIIKIDEISERDLNYEETKILESQYIINEKKNLFNKQFESWKDRADIKINYDVLEQISIDFFNE